MTLYNVHLYREMRLFFRGIDAASPGEAAHKVAACTTDEAESIEDCEGENLAALVDVVGDEEYEQSVVIDLRDTPSVASQPLIESAPELLEALSYLLEQTVDMDLKYGIGLSEGEEDARAKALHVIAKATGHAPDGRQS